jgi:hypothetical protein
MTQIRTYVGGLSDESNSSSSGDSSSNLKPCCGYVCVKSMLCAVCVDMMSSQYSLCCLACYAPPPFWLDLSSLFTINFHQEDKQFC